jgi:hypothetical protein
MSGAALSHRAATGGGVFLRHAKPPNLDICWSVDCLGTYVIELLHGAYCFYHYTFTSQRSPWGVYACIPD